MAQRPTFKLEASRVLTIFRSRLAKALLCLRSSLLNRKSFLMFLKTVDYTISFKDFILLLRNVASSMPRLDTDEAENVVLITFITISLYT